MMVTVIGGNGGTGAHVVRIATEQGHEVTCLSRSGSSDLPAGATDVRGDALNETVVSGAIKGADAVVVTVGGTKGSSRHRTEVTETVIEPMKTVGVRRLIVQSSLGAGDSGALMSAASKVFAKTVLARALADHNDEEAAVFESGLDWTVVRPGGLSDKAATGNVIAQETSDGRPMKSMIPRSDVAAHIVDILADPQTYGRALALGTSD